MHQNSVLCIKQGLVGLRNLNDQYVIDSLSKPLREVALDEQIHYFVSQGQANKIKNDNGMKEKKNDK